MSEVRDKMLALATKINQFTQQVVRLTNRKAEASYASDDAKTLNLTTPPSMKTTVDNSITPHDNNKANPHVVTPALLKGVTETSFNATIASSLSEGVLPVSQYGDLGTAALNIARAGFNLSFGEGIPFLCWGKSVKMPFFILTLDEDTTYYVYANLVNGVGSYTVSKTVLAENFTRIYIGKVLVGPASITTIAITRVSMLGNARVSTSGVGSAIPASAGNPTGSAALAASWKT